MDTKMNLKLYWENVLGYFEDEGWPLYDVDNEEKTALTYIRADNTTFRVFIWLEGESKILNLSWYFQSSVPSSKHHVILDLLNRLNYRFMMGKFVMNPVDGNLAFRISSSINGMRFSVEYFDSLMNWGVWRADEHYPKFMSLIYGSYTVDEVLEDKKRPQLRLVEKAEEQGELFEEDGAHT
jgi:hypothetical protein